ncbi:MAG: DUF6519 domain-containing protein [Chthoniobacteraceae bacterium]
MKNDISRNTFDPTKHFSRVLMQQGRVQLDADWNEQASIFMHYLRTLATDLIGPQGGPERQCGFEIIDAELAKKKRDDKDIGETPWAGKKDAAVEASVTDAGFFIGPGRYYVDGLLCESEGYLPYPMQAGFPFRETGEHPDKLAGSYLAYLDVWERHVSAVEDEDIREVALGGPDTATRAKVVSQVKLLKLEPATADPKAAADQLVKSTARDLPRLRARLKPEEAPVDACSILSPDSRYRGAENQLYRVEIHAVDDKNKATFKWSRENGSVIFPVTKAPEFDGKQTTVALAHFGRDAHLGLAEGDWVEIVDDDYSLRGRAEPLLQVHSIQRDEGTVILSGATKFEFKEDKRALLRRWDHRAGDKEHGGLVIENGAAGVVEATDADHGWLNLEFGVQIQFVPLAKEGRYRTGDYWLIPARTAGDAGAIEWPGSETNPDARPPLGIVHHYAPLAIVSAAAGVALKATDCRSQFVPFQPKIGPFQALAVSPDWPE